MWEIISEHMFYLCNMKIDLSDDYLISNCDWDLNYLKEIFTEDFECFDSLWSSNISDMELLSNVQEIERYCPITEDITIEDDLLCAAVEKIEQE